MDPSEKVMINILISSRYILFLSVHVHTHSCGLALIQLSIVRADHRELCDASSVCLFSAKYSARWVENVFFPTLNYKYILLQ